MAATPAAADLSDAGHEVRLWRRDGGALKPVIETGTIRLKDHRGVRDVKIAFATPIGMMFWRARFFDLQSAGL